jgi:hypothetical protein
MDFSHGFLPLKTAPKPFEQVFNPKKQPFFTEKASFLAVVWDHAYFVT